MPRISTCPRCSQMVSIPPEMDSATLVRCPLCGGEYPVGAAIDLAPPELTPVETGGEKTPVKAADADTKVAAPPVMPSFLLQHGAGMENEGDSETGFASAEIAETAETPDSPLDDEVCDLIAKHKQQAREESQNSAESPATSARSQRKPKSELRIFVEIIFGGILGLTVAYMAMAWTMGSKFPLPAPPRVLKPVLRFVLPDRIWAENQQPGK